MCNLWQLRRNATRPRRVRVLPTGVRGDLSRVLASVEGAGVLLGREGGRRRRWRTVPRFHAPGEAQLLVGHGTVLRRLCPRDVGCERLLVEPAEGGGPRLLFGAESDFLGTLLVE